MANLRSAVGAAMVGGCAGLLFAFCLSRVYATETCTPILRWKSINSLPAEISVGRNFVFLTESDVGNVKLIFLVGVLGVLGWVGWFVAVVTRAKPGSESFAHGLIAAF